MDNAILEMGMSTEYVKNQILSKADIMKELENIIPWLENWTGAFLHNVYHEFKNIQKYNSILFCALQSQTMQLDWARFSFCSGQYDMALRELRNIIESGFLFFKYDYKNEYWDLSIPEKYERIKEDIENDSKNGFGKTVFRNSGYSDWEDVYDNIYSPLSKYVHTGNNIERAMDIDRKGFNGVLNPYFNAEEIHNCISYYKKVVHTEARLMETILDEVYNINAEYVSIFQ